MPRARSLGRKIVADAWRAQWPSAKLTAAEYLEQIRGSWHVKPPDKDSQSHPAADYYYHGLFKHTTRIDGPKALTSLCNIESTGLKLYGDRAIVGNIQAPLQAAISTYVPSVQSGVLPELFRAGHFIASTLRASVPGTRHVWLQFFSKRQGSSRWDLALQVGGDASNGSSTTRPYINIRFRPLWLSDPSKLTSQPQIMTPYIEYEVCGTIKPDLLAGGPMLDLETVDIGVRTGLDDALHRSIQTVGRVSRERSFSSPSEYLFAVQRPLLDGLISPALASIMDFRSALFYILSPHDRNRWMHGILLNADGTPVEDAKEPLHIPQVSAVRNKQPWFASRPSIDRKLGMRITSIAIVCREFEGYRAEEDLSPKLEHASEAINSIGLPWVLDVADCFCEWTKGSTVSGLIFNSTKEWFKHLDFLQSLGPSEMLRIVSQPNYESVSKVTLTLPSYVPQKVQLTPSTDQDLKARITVALSVQRATAKPTSGQQTSASAADLREEMLWLAETAHTTVQSVLGNMQFESLTQASKFLSEALLRTLKISDAAADIVDVLVTCKSTSDTHPQVACNASWNEETVVTTITRERRRSSTAIAAPKHEQSSPVSTHKQQSESEQTVERSSSKMDVAMLEAAHIKSTLVRSANNHSISAQVGSESRTLALPTGFDSYSFKIFFSPAGYEEVSGLTDDQIARKIQSSIDRVTGDTSMLNYQVGPKLAESIGMAERVGLALASSESFLSTRTSTFYHVRHSTKARQTSHAVRWYDIILPSKPDGELDVRLQILIRWTANEDSPQHKLGLSLKQYLASARERVLELVASSLNDLIQRAQYQQWADVAALTIANNEWLLPGMQKVSVRIAKFERGVKGTFAGHAEAERHADGRVTLKDEHDLGSRSLTHDPAGEQGANKEEPNGLEEKSSDQAQVFGSTASLLLPDLPLEGCKLTRYPTGEMCFESTEAMRSPDAAVKTSLPDVDFDLAWSRPDLEASSLTIETALACFAALLKETAGTGLSWISNVASRSLQVFPNLSAVSIGFRATNSLSEKKQGTWLFRRLKFRRTSSVSPGSGSSTIIDLRLTHGQANLANGAATFSVLFYGRQEATACLDHPIADILSILQSEVQCVVQEMLASADVHSNLSQVTSEIASRLADHDLSPFMGTVESARVDVVPRVFGRPVHKATATRKQIHKPQRGIIVALGSNVGDRLEALEMACNTIDADPGMKVLRTSSLYETEPMYVQDQGRFLNGVCEIETTYQPIQLLDRLQDIENNLGRVKLIDKGPRSIDLDILLYQDLRFRNDRLRIPHALMKEREFVLRPLADIESGFWFSHEPPVSFQLSKVAGQGPPMFPQTPLGPPGEIITAQNPKRKTRVMSILNTTPDSFSDGGVNPVTDKDGLRDLIAAQIADGATIIDIGGQSSRPNAPDITAEEEIARILPAIEAFNELPEDSRKGVAISIDTYRAAVAEAGIKAGAHIVNDISAGTLDSEMLSTVARLGCTYVMMHMRGTPATMQNDENTDYEATGGLVESVATELRARIDAAQEAGIRRWRIILDPGIGFAKTQDQNLELLRRMPELVDHPKLRGLPWLVGSSRKGFIGKVTGVTEAKERTWGTAATVTAAVQGGADIVRVHDVKEMAQVVKMADGMYRV